MKKLNLCVIALTAIAGVSCNTGSPGNEDSDPKRTDSAYIDIAAMDTTVRPQDDFYQFCNGNWIKNTPVPDTDPRWGSFNELDKLNKKRLEGILLSVSGQDNKKGTPAQLIANFYKSYMDSSSLEKKGVEPLAPYLKLIDDHQGNDYTRLVAMLHNDGISAFFSNYVWVDAKNSSRYITYANQGGLGLPNKDYYTQSRFEDTREKYVLHVGRMLSFLGMDSSSAKAAAQDAMDVELALANYSRTPIELRDPVARYNPFSAADFSSKLKNFNWPEYRKLIFASDYDTLIVGQPEFFTGLDSLLAATNEAKIKNYLRWKTINSMADYLGPTIEQANFDFYSTELRGTKKMKPRKERVVNELTTNAINEAFGKLYVEEYFSESAKQKVNELVDNLFAAYRERMQTLDWMGDSTKQQAFAKLESFERKLGFPDKWKEYPGLEIKADNLVGNVVACNQFEKKENMEKLGKPVDRSEWGMPPHMVNAYYNPLFNEIVFPAGIMQPPFFDEFAEDAVNYGRMGLVIGHEITHGFDDKGSQYDANGNLENWWTESDRNNFMERAEKLGNTYASFCPLDSTCVQPWLTMGENIADLGGASMAFYAYQRTDEYKANKTRDGFTPSQRFFIAMGQIWKSVSTDEYLRTQIATDPHSPPKFRVNGPVMHMPEFFEAFNVELSDSMRVEESQIARIW